MISTSGARGGGYSQLQIVGILRLLVVVVLVDKALCLLFLIIIFGILHETPYILHKEVMIFFRTIDMNNLSCYITYI